MNSRNVDSGIGSLRDGEFTGAQDRYWLFTTLFGSKYSNEAEAGVIQHELDSFLRTKPYQHIVSLGVCESGPFLREERFGSSSNAKGVDVVVTNQNDCDAVRTESSPRSSHNLGLIFALFTSIQNSDALVGDLEERCKLVADKIGTRRANFWYCTQVIRSFGPIACAWTKKAALKPVIGVIAWAVAKGLVNSDSWLVALVEIWKRIRQ